MTFKVNWDEAYKAWKKSKLSQKQFYYSKEFKKFIRPGRIPTEATVHWHFSRMRKKLEPESVNSALEQQTSASKQKTNESKPEIEVVDTQTVNIVDADKYRSKKLRELLYRQNVRIRRLRQIAIRLPDGTTVEFETGNPELLVLEMIDVFKGERL